MPSERIAVPGFECSYKKQLAKGAFKSTFKVHEDGELFEGLMLSWNYEPPYKPLEAIEDAGEYRSWEPRFTASWYRDKSGKVSSNNGVIHITRRLFPTDPEVARKPQQLRLGLRADPDAPSFSGSGFNEVASRNSGFLYLRSNWAEFRAFFRGANPLWLVALKDDRHIVDKVELDRDMLNELIQNQPIAVEELNSLRANYREECVRTDDLEEGNIVIVT